MSELNKMYLEFKEALEEKNRVISELVARSDSNSLEIKSLKAEYGKTYKDSLMDKVNALELENKTIVDKMELIQSENTKLIGLADKMHKAWGIERAETTKKVGQLSDKAKEVLRRADIEAQELRSEITKLKSDFAYKITSEYGKVGVWEYLSDPKVKKNMTLISRNSNF